MADTRPDVEDVEALPPPPEEDAPADFWVDNSSPDGKDAAEATEASSPKSASSPSMRALMAVRRGESTSDLSAALSPAVLTKETDGNVVAAWLETFFKDVYAQPPENWVKVIKDTLLFPLAKRPLVAKAFLYGLRNKGDRFTKPQKQEWFRWVLPLFEYSVALKYNENEFSEEKFTEALSLRAKNEYDSTGIVIVVQLLHWAFQNEGAVFFANLLTEIKEKFEALGWTEEGAVRVTTIYKAFIAKVNYCHSARLRADSELPWWDNLLCFIGSIEDHVFYSPTYGFAPKPDPDLLGIHVARQGCADHELLVVAREMLAALRVEGAASANVQDDKAQRKVNSKRQELLKSCTQFLDAACHYSTVLTESVKISDAFETLDETKLANSVNDLVDIMSKRPRFAKSSKKQAITALQSAVNQKPVGMLDPWSGVKVTTSDSPDGKVVELAERWHDTRAVVYLLRRFGCPLCLHQATMLMTLKPALDEHGVRLIAVGNGDYNLAKQFKEGLNWPGEVYLDPESTSYKAIHLKRLSNWEVAKRYFTSLRVLTWFKNNPHKAQNQDGDGFQTGGVFIVGPGAGSSVIFSFKEIDNDPLSFPIPEAIVNACAADSKKKSRVVD